MACDYSAFIASSQRLQSVNEEDTLQSLSAAGRILLLYTIERSLYNDLYDDFTDTQWDAVRGKVGKSFPYN